ncbi:hypothetical protein BVX97_03830 [bacterium E08(2017)]|nr:hypothetical protein BVX97_03830 [bacterium E08(2017)]
MAPAGDWVCLRAALEAGCDSVYFGINRLNMRAGASNFQDSELDSVMEACHEKGIKGYLALNTIVYEGELDDLGEVLDMAVEAKVDAIICSDLSVIQKVRARELPVIISTQMSISNSESIKFFYETMGITRFVLARECTLEDIALIREDLNKKLGEVSEKIELEVFIHGAMCVSVSGRCFLSHYQYGKSANRGECLQPCRREYIITNEEEGESFSVGSDYLLSPKDLCTMPFIDKLIDAGIDRFKIEGRNRNAEYVLTVTKAYRDAVDKYFELCGNEGFEEDYEELKSELTEKMRKVYNRGFSNGFFMGMPADDWSAVSGSAAVQKKAYSGIVTNYYAKPGVAEILIHDNGFAVGDEIMFQGNTTGVLQQEVISMQVEHEAMEAAEKGMLVAVKTDKPVHRKDKVFIITDA